MKNNPLNEAVELKKPHVNLFYRIMRITTFLLFFCSFCSFASTAHSQSSKVTIKKSNVSLLEVLNEIENQTNYLFIYSNDVDVTRSVSLNADRKSVASVLSALFKKDDVHYVLEGTHIVLTKRKIADDSRSIQQTAQAEPVKGVVLDRNGEPIIGASVAVKGGTVGTITDLDGKFSLEVPQKTILIISYIGYKAQEIVVGKERKITVRLEEDSQALDEVIVVGYGTSTKRALIASVSTVDAKQMEDIPVANMTQGLAGRSRGLIVVGNGGGVNKIQNISIRGGATPLVVIDGVIRDYNDFVTMSPEDVENLSILKDASATAVYGSRATNGILQITTKQGASGKPQIEYNFNQSYSQPAIWADKLNSWERAEYANIARENDGLEALYQPDAIQKMKDGTDLLNYGNTDWRKLVLKDWAPQTKHSIRMIGGTEANKYYVSLGHIDQKSLFRNSNVNYMKRTNFRLSQTSFITSIGLRTTATLDGYMQKVVNPYTSTASGYYHIFSHIQNKNPLTPGVNKNGLPYNTSDNPVAETASDGGYQLERKNAINGNLALEWNLPWVKGLKARANGNYRYYHETHKNWRKDPATYDWESEIPQYANTPKLDYSTKVEKTWNLQYFLEYSNTFKKHSVTALGGYECTYSSGEFYSAGRENYIFPIDQLWIGPSGTQINSGNEWESGRAGWIAQLKYNYDNRYFWEAALRYDGSDNFPKNRRWGTFFSTSLGWVVSDEAFMESLREKHIIDLLKLRGSYGQVGLDNWGSSSSPYHLGRFEYLNSYNLNNKAWVVNGKYVPGFSEGAIPSPDITWFTTHQWNLGFDFGSLNNRLYGGLDYFYYQTSGFLYAPDPLKVGYTAPLGMNLPRVSTDGELRRAGFEFQLGWKDNIGKVKYDVSANFTTYNTMWNRQPAEATTALLNPYTRSTQEYGYYGSMYTSQGYYKDANDVYNSPKLPGSYNLTAGDIKYKDVNGDGQINESDYLRLGKSSSPRGNYGINLKADYKGWSFSVLFQGATPFDMYAGDALRMSSGQTAGGMSVIYDFQKDFWTKDNPNAKFPRLMSSAGLNGGNNYKYSDFWLINGAYFRLKDFKIGYDFKHSLLRSVTWLSRANVAITGQNIFTISEVTKYGLDPENSSMENYGYPNERAFAISINLGF